MSSKRGMGEQVAGCYADCCGRVGDKDETAVNVSRQASERCSSPRARKTGTQAADAAVQRSTLAVRLFVGGASVSIGS